MAPRQRGKIRLKVRAALRRFTPSPIVALQPHSSYDVPSLIYFYTADDKMYCAEKKGGKWHISEPVLVY